MSRFLLAVIAVVALAGSNPAGACDHPLARGAVRLVKAEVRFATTPGRLLLHGVRPTAECPCAPAIPKPIVVPEKMPAKPAPKLPNVFGAGNPQSFESALREQLTLHPDEPGADRVLRVLNMEDGRSRDRILHRLERHVATHLDVKGEAGKINWAEIDWEKFFAAALKFILAILPFLI